MIFSLDCSGNASLCFTDPCEPCCCLVQACQQSYHALQIRDSDSALVVSQLLFLEAEETSKPIHLYINSPGGSVTAGLAIYDTVCPLYAYRLPHGVSADVCRCRSDTHCSNRLPRRDTNTLHVHSTCPPPFTLIVSDKRPLWAPSSWPRAKRESDTFSLMQAS